MLSDDKEHVGQPPRLERPGHHKARESKGHPWACATALSTTAATPSTARSSAASSAGSRGSASPRFSGKSHDGTGIINPQKWNSRNGGRGVGLGQDCRVLSANPNLIVDEDDEAHGARHLRWESDVATSVTSERTRIGDTFVYAFSKVYGCYAAKQEIEVDAETARSAGESLHDQFAPMVLVVLLTFLVQFVLSDLRVVDSLVHALAAAGLTDAVTAMAAGLECMRKAKKMKIMRARTGTNGANVHARLQDMGLLLLVFSVLFVFLSSSTNVPPLLYCLAFLSVVILFVLFESCLHVELGESLCLRAQRTEGSSSR